VLTVAGQGSVTIEDFYDAGSNSGHNIIDKIGFDTDNDGNVDGAYIDATDITSHGNNPDALF